MRVSSSSCDGPSWNLVAPESAVREHPGPVSVVMTANSPRDLLRIYPSGEVRVERYGLVPERVCMLSVGRLAGLIRTLESAGFAPGPWAPRTDLDDWADVYAVFGGSSHSARIAIEPVPTEAQRAQTPAGVVTFREQLFGAVRDTQSPPTQQALFLDEIRRFVVVYNQARGAPMLHGGQTFEANGFEITREQHTRTEERLWVSFNDNSVSDTGHQAPQRYNPNAVVPSSNPFPPPLMQLFVFRAVPNGWLLQRPAAMPARRPARASRDFSYPGQGERGGVEAPVFRARLIRRI